MNINSADITSITRLNSIELPSQRVKHIPYGKMRPKLSDLGNMNVKESDIMESVLSEKEIRVRDSDEEEFLSSYTPKMDYE